MSNNRTNCIQIHLNSFRKVICGFIFLFNSVISIAQVTYAVDSPKAPFVAKKYFTPQMNESMTTEQSLSQNSYLSPLQNTSNEAYLLGNHGSELIPIAYKTNFYQTIQSGRSMLHGYFYNASNIPYYSLNKPLSEVGMTIFGNGTEHFKALLSQNLSKSINIGGGINRMNNKGYFLRTATSHFNLYAYAVYQNKRLRANIEYLYNEAKVQENGGLSFSIYDSSSFSNWGFAPINLSNAQTYHKQTELSFNTRWLISPAPSKDTGKVDSFPFLPIKSNVFIDNKISVQNEAQYYNDPNASRSFYGLLVSDTSQGKILRSAYSSDRISEELKITYNTKTKTGQSLLLEGNGRFDYYNLKDVNNQSASQLIPSIGGSLLFHLNETNSFEAKLNKPLAGYMIQDLYFGTTLRSQISLFELIAHGEYVRQMPGYFLNHYTSTLFSTFNNFSTQNTLEISGKILSKPLKASLEVQYFNIENLLLYQKDLSPIQANKNLLQIRLNKEMSYKSLYTRQNLIYLSAPFSRIWYRGTFGIRSQAFKKKLEYDMGIDLTLNANYALSQYNPAIMQQYNWEEASTSKIFPIVDLFVSAKISSVLLTLKFENLCSKYFARGQYVSQYYPIIPYTFYLKFDWRFLE